MKQQLLESLQPNLQLRYEAGYQDSLRNSERFFNRVYVVSNLGLIAASRATGGSRIDDIVRVVVSAWAVARLINENSARIYKWHAGFFITAAFLLVVDSWGVYLPPRGTTVSTMFLLLMGLVCSFFCFRRNSNLVLASFLVLAGLLMPSLRHLPEDGAHPFVVGATFVAITLALVAALWYTDRVSRRKFIAAHEASGAEAAPAAPAVNGGALDSSVFDVGAALQ